MSDVDGCNLKSPKKVHGTSEMVRIVTRLVSVLEIIDSAGVAMVAGDGQEIIGMIINHLLRSACAVDLKSSVDTCG